MKSRKDRLKRRKKRVWWLRAQSRRRPLCISPKDIDVGAVQQGSQPNWQSTAAISMYPSLWLAQGDENAAPAQQYEVYFKRKFDQAQRSNHRAARADSSVTSGPKIVFSLFLSKRLQWLFLIFRGPDATSPLRLWLRPAARFAVLTSRATNMQCS